MSITRTSPACALPGAIQSPGFAAWKVAVASATTATLDTSPVEASTPLGTSHATTTAPSAPAALMASMAPAAGSRGSPEKPVPRMASTTAAAPANSPAENGFADAPREPFQVRQRVAAKLAWIAQQEDRHVTPAVAQHPAR